MQPLLFVGLSLLSLSALGLVVAGNACSPPGPLGPLPAFRCAISVSVLDVNGTTTELKEEQKVVSVDSLTPRFAIQKRDGDGNELVSVNAEKRYVFGFGSSKDPNVCQFSEMPAEQAQDIKQYTSSRYLDLFHLRHTERTCLLPQQETVRGKVCDVYLATGGGKLYLDVSTRLPVLTRKAPSSDDSAIYLQNFECETPAQASDSWFVPPASANFDLSICTHTDDFHA